MKIYCSRCKKTIPDSGPRVVIDGNYVCGTCLYELEHGRESYERQVRLASLAAGRCVCKPRLVKRKWEGADRLTNRRVHDFGCPKHKDWMSQETIAQ